jgi:hypothetical protein
MSSAVTSRPATYGEYRDAVDWQLDRGLMFEEVEEFINFCPLDEEQKAALWLWAWLKRSPAELPACAGSEVIERTRLLGLWDGRRQVHGPSTRAGRGGAMAPVVDSAHAATVTRARTASSRTDDRGHGRQPGCAHTTRRKGGGRSTKRPPRGGRLVERVRSYLEIGG